MLTDEQKARLRSADQGTWDDLYAAMERIVSEQVADARAEWVDQEAEARRLLAMSERRAAERALVERIEAALIDLRDRARKSPDGGFETGVLAVETAVRAALARPDADEPTPTGPACGDEHEFNPAVTCTCTEIPNHQGPHRSDWIDQALGKPYTWGTAATDAEATPEQRLHEVYLDSPTIGGEA